GKGIGLDNGGGACTTCSNRSILNAQISTLTAQYTVENNKLLAGDSQTLMAAINGNASPGDLKNMLTAQSPYLSDAILSAYFILNGVPPGHIKDIHELNAPVSASVWAILDALSLPSGIKDQITQNQNAIKTSGRTNEQGYINALLTNIQAAYNSKVRDLLTDTTLTNANDSVRVAITNPFFSDRIIKLVNYLLDTKQYASAQQKIDSMSIKSDYISWANFKSIQSQLLQSPYGYYTLKTDAKLKDYILTVANDPQNLAHAEAQNILHLAVGTIFDEYTGLPPMVNNGNRMTNIDSTTTDQTENKLSDVLLTAIPNPATSEVTIGYKLPDNALTGQLKVIDITGRVLYQTDVVASLKSIYINTNNWVQGMYYYSLIVNNRVVGTKPVIITK
ncbi:MAG: T9SS type A sorting domain-containing protein, partial [Bacteroidia bacterium]